MLEKSTKKVRNVDGKNTTVDPLSSKLKLKFTVLTFNAYLVSLGTQLDIVL